MFSALPSKKMPYIPNYIKPDTCNEPDNVAIASRQERNLPLAPLDFNIAESKKDCKPLLSQEAGGSDLSEQSFRSLKRAPDDK